MEDAQKGTPKRKENSCFKATTQPFDEPLSLKLIYNLSHLTTLLPWQPINNRNCYVIESWVEWQMFKATQTKLFALQNFH